MLLTCFVSMVEDKQHITMSRTAMVTHNIDEQYRQTSYTTQVINKMHLMLLKPQNKILTMVTHIFELKSSIPN